MKTNKLWSILMMLVVVLGTTIALSSCNKDDKNSSASGSYNNSSTVTTARMQAVDLGLSVKWANMNVGATTPEGYGLYFAWGDARGYSQAELTVDKEHYQSGLFEYKWISYKSVGYNNISYFTKYCSDSNYGTVDNKTTLDPEDDAAHVNWGGSWRMPTPAEFDELSKKCEWTWTSVNGINGYLVTSKVNGNSIFMPAAGSASWDYEVIPTSTGGRTEFLYSHSVKGLNTGGTYWASTLADNFFHDMHGSYNNPDQANGIWFNSEEASFTKRKRTDAYCSVRAVCP